MSVAQALAVLHFYFERSQAIAAVGHAGGGGRVGDQNGIFRPFCLQKQLNDGWIEVNSIRDDVGRDLRIGQHLAEDAGIAMIQRPHGVKSVSGVASAGGDSGARGGQGQRRSVRCSRRLRVRRFGDDFDGALQLRRDGHDANVSARRLPEAIKRRHGRRQQILRRMHAAPGDG